MSQAEALYHLQEIELRIMRAQKRLLDIAAALEDDEAVKAAQDKVNAAEEALRPLRARVNDLELEIQSNVEKAKATEDRLYSGTVKNPKELQDMQQEIAALKNWHGELENRLLEAMVDVEEAEAHLATAEEQLASVTARWESEHRDLLDEQTQLETQGAGDEQQREKALQRVTPESLKTFTAMKPRKANQPVAVMNGRTCGVCGIQQTRAIEQEVRRGADLVCCEGCGRILVIM
jgi:predicted  nucleic acid-binding Zn-ribbon protein